MGSMNEVLLALIATLVPLATLMVAARRPAPAAAKPEHPA